MINFFDPPRRSLTRDDPSSFAAPTQFGPFRVLHQIGVGALGPVFRTYEPERDRLVAVKTFSLDITPEQGRALADELSRVSEAGLFHPSIVEPIAAGVEGTVPYAAEEYVSAESLDVAMRHYAPASIETVLPFITQLAGAIDFARAAGVGHGALHPRDIFVTPEEARATGFGVVEALERVGYRAPVRRPYTAPERIGAEPWGTPADVFSLAAITYELLTGRRPSGLGAEIGPLTAGTPNQWMDAIHAVLARGMNEKPGARFTTALSFASALEAAARGEDTIRTSAQGVVAPPPAAEPAVGPIAAAATAAPVPPAEPASAPKKARAGRARQQPLPAVEEEDVTAERDEDEAHHHLTLLEREHEPVRDADLPMDADSQAEADADRFFMDVAAAATEADPADDLRPDAAKVDRRAVEEDEVTVAKPPPFEPRDLLHAPAPARDATPPASPYGSTFGEPLPPLGAEPSESRPMWPLALMLLIGLIAGFGGGYALWAPSKSANETASGREFSEQAVAPSAATTPKPAPATGTTPPPAPAATTPPAPAPRTSTPPAPQPARATTGTLVVRSVPSGASVTLNGRWRGRTPLTLAELPFARYDVRVVRPGYTTATDAIALSTTDPSRSLSFRLEPQPRATPAPERRTTTAPAPSRPAASSQPETFTGSIYVDSRPRGARVSIDGKAVGVTPLRIPDVRIGTRIVRLELPDHRIWSSTARVSAGQEARVTGSLERIQ